MQLSLYDVTIMARPALGSPIFLFVSVPHTLVLVATTLDVVRLRHQRHADASGSAVPADVQEMIQEQSGRDRNRQDECHHQRARF